MKQQRSIDHQIVTILREAETGDLTIEALCRTGRDSIQSTFIDDSFSSDRML